MNKTFILAFFLFISLNSFAQITFKSEFLGTSAFRDEDNKKVDDYKGSATVYQTGINIPLYVKTDKSNKAIMWGLGISGAYVSLDNKNFKDNIVLSEIMNAQIGVLHKRPLNDKWSLLSSVGIGIYAPRANISEFRFENTLASIGIIFIRQMNANMELGGGVALNNAFGYPMVLPVIYFNWMWTGRFILNISAFEGFQLSAGYKFNNYFQLDLVGEVSGQLALYKEEEKKMMFTHQYIIGGIQPTFRINDKIEIPITIGVNAIREAYSKERKIKFMFTANEYDPYFQVAPYVSIALNVNF